MRQDVRRGTAKTSAAALGSCGPNFGRSASRRAERPFVTGETIVIDGGYAATT